MTEKTLQRRHGILCTLGPASMNERTITRLTDLGVELFRINLSHTRLEDLADVIDFIQSRTDVAICLDTEGAQVRTGRLPDTLTALEEHQELYGVGADPRDGIADPEALIFYPDWVIDALQVGAFISIDFHDALVQVIDKQPGRVKLRVVVGGRIGSNKAVTVHHELALLPLTDKDRAALAIGAEKGLGHIALSFANRAEDVAEIRAVFGRDAFVISKIECRNGLKNLKAIALQSNAVLIDRGDLSREVDIERIPGLQKEIIKTAKALRRPVYVATNLLESMVVDRTPTRAEVNDVYNTLMDGADGLVLAAETAIGRHPVGCTSMIARLINEFEGKGDVKLENLPEDSRSFLIEPHGGVLVNRAAGPDDHKDLDRLPRLEVTDTDLMDCQQIANGIYSPLDGFMTRETLGCVLEDHRLPSGIVWPMPVILQLSAEAAARLPASGRIALTDAKGAIRAALDVEEVAELDLDTVAKRWFGTTDTKHPGVARLYAGGGMMLGGPITLIDAMQSRFPQYEFTPFQTRFLFSHKGWSRVVGFHTRNVAHRVHEHLQLTALEQTHADGLFIHPVIGPKKAGDFLPEPILASYRRLIESGAYPPGRAVLAGFATYSRFSGPREAVFTALCRKNFGCSHFIVGRDHTGVGDFYAGDETRALFDALDDLGIEPVYFPPIGYNPQHDAYEPIDGQALIEQISGTEVRSALKASAPIPTWFMRAEIQDLLRGEIALGRPIFAS